MEPQLAQPDLSKNKKLKLELMKAVGHRSAAFFVLFPTINRNNCVHIEQTITRGGFNSKPIGLCDTQMLVVLLGLLVDRVSMNHWYPAPRSGVSFLTNAC